MGKGGREKRRRTRRDEDAGGLAHGFLRMGGGHGAKSCSVGTDGCILIRTDRTPRFSSPLVLAVSVSFLLFTDRPRPTPTKGPAQDAARSS